MRKPMVGVIGGTAEWVFALHDRLSVTVSAADHLMDTDTDDLTLLLWRDVAAVHDLTGPVPPCRIVKEKRATFAATPAQDARRPAARTAVGQPVPRRRLDRHRPAGDDRGRAAVGQQRPPLSFAAAPEACRRLSHGLDEDIDRAAQALTRRQRDDGHWVFELEADATIPSEYVLLRHYLGEPDDLELERKIAVYLRRIQGEHGGWPLFHDGAFDISASVKAYFCLKMIGDSPDAPHMAKARNAILAHGGAEQANVFTRILLAQFGAALVGARADHAGRDHPAAALVSRSTCRACRTGRAPSSCRFWCWRRCASARAIRAASASRSSSPRRAGPAPRWRRTSIAAGRCSSTRSTAC